MNQEVKEALLSFRRREQWALQDEIRRAEYARLDEEFEKRKAANAAQREFEEAVSNARNEGFKAGFEAAWRLPR